jgi:hypothetical protein
MKYAQRPTAAIAAVSLVGVGAIAAAVTGVADAGGGATPADATRTIDTSQRDALAAMLHDLAGGSRQLDARLRSAHHDLLRETRALRRQRALSRLPVAVSLPPATPGYATPSPAAAAPSAAGEQAATGSTAPSSAHPAPPPTHTSTGASGATGGGSSGDGSDDGEHGEHGGDRSSAQGDDD